MNHARNRLRLFYFALLVALLLATTAMSGSDQPTLEYIKDGHEDTIAILTVDAPADVTYGNSAIVIAKLTLGLNRALADRYIKLAVDFAPEMTGVTDASGVAIFRLPATLEPGAHKLRASFDGGPGLGATIAWSKTTVHPALQSAATPVAKFPVTDTPPEQQGGVSKTAPSATLGVQAPAASPIGLAAIHMLMQFNPFAASILASTVPTSDPTPTDGTPQPTPLELALAAPEVQPTLHVESASEPAKAPVAAIPTPVPAVPPPVPATPSMAPAALSTQPAVARTKPGMEDKPLATAVRVLPTVGVDPGKPALAFLPLPQMLAGTLSFIQPLTLQTIRVQPVITHALAFVSGTSDLAVGFLGMPGAVALGALLVMGLVLSPVFVTRRRAGSRPTRPGNVAVIPEKRPAIPMTVWYGLRVLSVGIALGLTIVLFVRPAMGLKLFWGAFIPALPLLFFVAPAVWRNICPMAALNQTPRLFSFSRALTLPKWMQEYGFVVGVCLFLVLASSRKVLFNQNGPALAVLILCSLAMAFVMGNFFKGKSGWCSSICPLLPIQRIYGQTPFVSVTHAHCQPCLACTKNCYDLSPQNAMLADLYDDQGHSAAYRKVFVGLFPGFVLGFFLVPNPPAIPIWQMYGLLALASLVSLGTFMVAETFVKVTSNKITVVYAALALNLFYWFNSLTLGSLIANPPSMLFVWSLRTTVFALTLFWIYRTYRKEATFIELTLAPPTLHGASDLPLTGGTAAPANPEVVVEPEGKRIVVDKNRTLLDIIESNNLPIEAGCRMGLCGADPICVHDGMDHLSKMGNDERTTLERLGLAPDTRLACMARVRGNVRIGLTPQKPDVFRTSIVAGFKYDQSVERVVIVGNGIAGVTAADHVRRRHPKCEIHLIGRERHHLYNRMGITRLIYGRSAMQGLYLLPDQWYDDFNVTCWLNTQVTSIDAQTRQVTLGTGETLAYDRLILTTGSQSYVPPIKGFGLPGSFVLRTAEDAMAIRAYVQEHTCRTAVVAGGGLLGLEAAYGLSKLGLSVTVLERSDALLSRQLDARGADFLYKYLEQMGIHVIMQAETARVDREPDADGRTQQVVLRDGPMLPCDLFLVAAGIRAELELAQSIGLSTNQGIIVDAEMRTTDPCVFAAGDVAEFEGKLYGLWPVAVGQAEIAAANAVKAESAAAATYTETPPVTMLKVVGIDLTSIGRIHAQSDQELVIALEELESYRYRKLIIAGGKIVGAILLGYPQEAPGVTAAVKDKLDVTADLPALESGNWACLSL